MRLSAPFRAHGDHIAIALTGASVLFTTRRGGVSEGPFATLNLGLWTEDDAAHVAENRERVAALAGIPRERFAQGRQVHGTTVRALHGAPDPAAPPQPADGQATAEGGVAPIVLVADCLPIALAGAGAVAMLHAGWRGLAAAIVRTGVDTVRELGCDGPIEAAIGPGAGGCCYEVGDEVADAFADTPEAVRRADGRVWVDLKAAARSRLHDAGVEVVHDVGLCTICSEAELFFSHRRDNGLTGRQAGVCWRR